MNNICYIHRSATLVHPDGRHKTYLYSYNKVTHVRNVIIDNGRESIEKDGRTSFCIQAIIKIWLNLGYFIQESKNLNEGKYAYDLFEGIPI